jgi:hypothetical protein
VAEVGVDGRANNFDAQGLEFVDAVGEGDDLGGADLRRRGTVVV